jgi:hypothetical protein
VSLMRYQESPLERVILWLRFWLVRRFLHLARLSITAGALSAVGGRVICDYIVYIRRIG